MKLNIDKEQDINKAAWFIFAPPTGNIFYSMPLVGDNVMLYFQNEYDRPVVTGCVRKNGATCGRCANPDNRYYATESGNYLDVLPGAVNLYRGGMYVTFNDENGISMSSNTSLNIGTPAGISMSAGSVSISGSKKLIVSKSKGGFISLEGDLYNEGTVVYENGSCRELFAPFTDDVPDLGELLAAQSQVNLNRFNPTMDLVSAMAGSQAKAGECYITHDTGNSRQINEYEYDAEKVRNAKHIEDKVKYLFKYEYDRFLTYGSEVFKYIALIDGMDPKYAQLYGDFTSGMIAESALTISISGIKSGNALINGEVASQSDIVAGSGLGNLGKNKNGSREIILDVRKTHESARNLMVEILEDTGEFKNGSKPYIGRMQSSYGYEKQIGRQSLDGKVRWRLDYDNEMGVHYNIENFSGGKGVKSEKIVIPIDITYEEYKLIIDSWNGVI